MRKHRSSLGQGARDQLAVLRLALRLTAGLFSTMAFRPEHQPFGDAYEALDWLRAQFAPLARQEHVIRVLLPVLDPVNSQRAPWTRPGAAKRELQRLASRIMALDDHMKKVRR